MVPIFLSVNQPAENDFLLFIVFDFKTPIEGFFDDIFNVDISLSLLKSQAQMLINLIKFRNFFQISIKCFQEV